MGTHSQQGEGFNRVILRDCETSNFTKDRLQLHPAPVLERDTDILDSRALVTRGGHCGQPGSKLVPILRPAPLGHWAVIRRCHAFACCITTAGRVAKMYSFLKPLSVYLNVHFGTRHCLMQWQGLGCADWGSVSCMSGGGLLLRLNTWSSVTDWDRRSSSTESCQLLWSPWWSPPTPAASSSAGTTTAWRPARTQSSSPTLCSRSGLAILTSMLPSFSQYLEKPLNRNFSLLKSHISPFTHV